MKLDEVLGILRNKNFLLRVDGLCDGLYGGADKLKEMPYYGTYKETYKDRKVKGMSVLLTNGMPELHIELWEA